MTERMEGEETPPHEPYATRRQPALSLSCRRQPPRYSTLLSLPPFPASLRSRAVEYRRDADI